MPVIPLPGGITPTPGMGDGFGPCEPWEPIWCVDLPTGSEAISGHAVQMATEILWAKTGMRYDQCSLTIRPCRSDCFGGATWPFGGFWWEVGTLYPQPALINGNWYNLTCGACSGGCSCTVVHEIVLPGGPVTAISQVKVDGLVLPTSAYRLDDWRQLVSLDGPWPICNDLNKADTEDGTWSVTATYGQPVPTMGQMAVGELAHQLILACMGDECCKLPYNITQMARQGVTISYPDMSDLFGSDRNGRSANRLGLQFCDMFIDAANPAGLRAKSRSYNIDGSNPRITGV